LHHGIYPAGVDWLNEAVAECYIPLLNVFNDLLNEGISPNVTLDISPVLCEQMENPDFKQIFVNYCDARIDAARKDHLDFLHWVMILIIYGLLNIGKISTPNAK